MPQIELCVLEKVEIAWQAGKGRREGGGAARCSSAAQRARPESEVEAEKVAFKVSFYESTEREGRERMASPVETTTTKKKTWREQELS